MGLELFREALSSKLGQVITPQLAAWLEAHAFDRVDRSFGPERFEPRHYREFTFRVERFRDVCEELHALHVEHWTQTEAYHHDIPLQPDYDSLRANELAGRLLQLTARDNDGRMVGNIRMYLYRSTHTSTLVAKEDTFYLAPAARRGFTAIRFWQFMEDCLRSLDVLEVMTDSKVANDVGRLNEYLGYTHVANAFHKRL